MALKFPIYMDSHATTPVDPRVVEAMIPCFTTAFGNASSSSHSFGWEAEKRVEKAREQVAALIGAEAKEIIFTSGATESNNMALKGIIKVYAKESGGHIITQATEHKSILDTCKYLQKKGVRVTVLGVDQTGKISLEELEKAIQPDTLLVSIMAANNEIGTIQPLKEIGAITRKHRVLFHVDAAQAAGKIPLDVHEMNIDLLSFSAHKMYGPKGVGALYVRSENPHVRIAPLLHGGGHEQGLRSGTLNVPAIVGFGVACDIALHEMKEEEKRVRALRDRLHKGIESKLSGVYVNGHPVDRLYNNLNLSFSLVDSESLMMGLTSEVAVSSGSACSSGNTEPSYVLKALGLNPERLLTSVRFGLSRFTTEEEIDYTIDKVVALVKKLRELSPFYGIKRAEAC